MGFQPGLMGAVIRTDLMKAVPERAGVIEVVQVAQLMKDDVIAHLPGHLDQSPIEGDGSLFRAGAPAGALVPDGYAARVPVVLPGPVRDGNGQELFGVLLKVGFDQRAQVQGLVRGGKPEGAQGHDPLVLFMVFFQDSIASVEEDGLAGVPRFAGEGQGIDFGQLTLDPGGAGSDKGAGLPEAAPQRERDPQAAILAHVEEVVTGPGIPLEMDGEALVADGDGLPGRRGDRFPERQNLLLPAHSGTVAPV